MIIVFFICIHLIALLVYAIQIEKNRSHLQYIHLLFALCMPFAGELCLVFAEMTRPELEKGEPKQKRVAEFSGDPICEDEKEVQQMYHETGEGARKALTYILDRNPQNLVALLHGGLRAKDREVVHLSAAALMRFRRTYENAIEEKAKQYQKMPQNASVILVYDQTIEEYLESGLPDEGTALVFRNRRVQLLDAYLKLMPRDMERQKKLEQIKQNLYESKQETNFCEE